MPTTSKAVYDASLDAMYTGSSAVICSPDKEELNVLIEQHLNRYWGGIIGKSGAALPGKWTKESDGKFVLSSEVKAVAESFYASHARKFLEGHQAKRRGLNQVKATSLKAQL